MVRRRASASSTKRWCSRAASARRFCSVPRRGGSSRSPTIASSSRRRRANPERCRSGRRTRPDGRSSSDAISARWSGRCDRCHPPARSNVSYAITISIVRRPRTWCDTSPIKPRRPARCPTTAPSSSNAAATSWATGGSASSRRSAAASTRRGRWRSSNARARKPAATSRRCGPTTGSSCAFRRRTRHPIRS